MMPMQNFFFDVFSVWTDLKFPKWVFPWFRFYIADFHNLIANEWVHDEDVTCVHFFCETHELIFVFAPSNGSDAFNFEWTSSYSDASSSKFLMLRLMWEHDKVLSNLETCIKIGIFLFCR